MLTSRIARVAVGVLAAGAVAVFVPSTAAAATVPVGASGSVDVPVPALPGAALNLTVGDKTFSLTVPPRPAGTLSVEFSGNTTATVDVEVTACAAPASGKVVTVTGLSAGAEVSASLTSTLAPTVTVGKGVPGANRTVVASVCTTGS